MLRRHPQETVVASLGHEYIRTASALTVQHLKKFLGLKLSRDRYEDFQIVIVANGKGVILDENLSLEDIRKTILERQGGGFVLHFRVKPSA